MCSDSQRRSVRMALLDDHQRLQIIHFSSLITGSRPVEQRKEKEGRVSLR